VSASDDVADVVTGAGADADVVLLDLELHGVLVVDRVGELTGAGRRVVVYSQHTDAHLVQAVYEAGAEFIAKHEGAEHCVDTILAAASDRPHVTPAAAGAILADSRPQRPELSEREVEALRLWFQSMSKASVAARMGIKESTVKQYIDRARVKYAKIGRKVASKDAMLARAIEDGIVRAHQVGEYTSFAKQRTE
jgi:DNA-binding NarL/FixJ family response regulator